MRMGMTMVRALPCRSSGSCLAAIQGGSTRPLSPSLLHPGLLWIVAVFVGMTGFTFQGWQWRRVGRENSQTSHSLIEGEYKSFAATLFTPLNNFRGHNSSFARERMGLVNQMNHLLNHAGFPIVQQDRC